MAKKKQFHHGDLKRALFEAAVELLDEHGPEGVTIRAVARAAGVSHSAPVNHYKDRGTLLTAIAQTQFEFILSEIKSALANMPKDPSPRVEMFARTLMEFGFKYPHRYQMLWRSDLVDHENPDLLNAMDNVYDQLCVEIGKATPDVDVDTETIAVALWSLAHGYVDMRLSGMFVPLDDRLSGKPRPAAMMELLLSCLK